MTMVPLTSLKKLEGYLIQFHNGTLTERSGIITDILIPKDLPESKVVKGDDIEAVILWDTDEKISFDDAGKKIIEFDDGVSVYPLSEICDPSKFKILTKK